jgi:hypothetical protein
VNEKLKFYKMNFDKKIFRKKKCSKPRKRKQILEEVGAIGGLNTSYYILRDAQLRQKVIS